MREVDQLPDLTFSVFSMGCGDEHKRRGTAAELLQAIPYLFSDGYIPPLAVVNNVLSSGKADAGMSGGIEWAPFRVSEAQHAAIVERLMASGSLGKPLQYQEPPAWVTTQSEFMVWVAFVSHGVPIQENLKLTKEMEEINTLMIASEERGDEASRVGYLLQLNDLSMQWSDLVSTYRG